MTPPRSRTGWPSGKASPSGSSPRRRGQAGGGEQAGPHRAHDLQRRQCLLDRQLENERAGEPRRGQPVEEPGEVEVAGAEALVVPTEADPALRSQPVRRSGRVALGAPCSCGAGRILTEGCRDRRGQREAWGNVLLNRCEAGLRGVALTPGLSPLRGRWSGELGSDVWGNVGPREGVSVRRAAARAPRLGGLPAPGWPDRAGRSVPPSPMRPGARNRGGRLALTCGRPPALWSRFWTGAA